MDNAGLVVIPLIVACSTFGAANASVFVVARYVHTCIIIVCLCASLCVHVFVHMCIRVYMHTCECMCALCAIVQCL